MNPERRTYQKKYREEYKARTKRVNLTFSKPEFLAFSRGAESNAGGMKTTTYIKQLALAGLHSQAMIPARLETELKTLRFAVLNIANNVNQIAHHSNTVRAMSVADENNLLQHLKQLEESIHTYTQGRILEG